MSVHIHIHASKGQGGDDNRENEQVHRGDRGRGQGRGKGQGRGGRGRGGQGRGGGQSHTDKSPQSQISPDDNVQGRGAHRGRGYRGRRRGGGRGGLLGQSPFYSSSTDLIGNEDMLQPFLDINTSQYDGQQGNANQRGRGGGWRGQGKSRGLSEKQRGWKSAEHLSGAKSLSVMSGNINFDLDSTPNVDDLLKSLNQLATGGSDSYKSDDGSSIELSSDEDNTCVDANHGGNTSSKKKKKRRQKGSKKTNLAEVEQHSNIPTNTSAEFKKLNIEPDTPLLTTSASAPNLPEDVSLKLDKVFKENSGFVDLEAIYNNNEIMSALPSGFDILEWFLNPQSGFICRRLPDSGSVHQIVMLLPIDMRPCFKYNTKSGCDNEECKYLHVCKGYISGACSHAGNCGLAHDFQDTKVRAKLMKLGLERTKKVQLQKWLSACLPEICHRHVSSMNCIKCPCEDLHICATFCKNECPNGKTCPLGHDLHTPQNMTVLRSFKIDRLSDVSIKKMVKIPLIPVTHNKADKDTLKQSKTAEGKQQMKAGEGTSKKKKARKKGDDGKTNEKSLKSKSQDKEVDKSGPSSLEKQASRKSSVGSDTGAKPKSSKPKIEMQICENNLRGRCSYGNKCRFYHYPMPYLWQYNNGDAWQKFTKPANRIIESKFCDVEQNVFVISKGGLAEEEVKRITSRFQDIEIVELNFIQMDLTLKSAHSLPYHVPVRRLSTMPHVTTAPNRTFATRWHWYYYLNGEWVAQQNPQNRIPIYEVQIELAFVHKRPSFKVTAPDGQCYIVDFESMIVHDEQNKFECLLRRRPEFQSRQIQKFQNRQKEKRERASSDASDQSNTSTETPILSVSISEPTAPVSPDWEPMEDYEDLKSVPLPAYNQEHQQVAGGFCTSMGGPEKVTVTGVTKIQNTVLWNDFWSTKEEVKKSTAFGYQERQLYYYCESTELAEYIMAKNFVNIQQQCDLLMPYMNANGPCFSSDAQFLHSRLCHDERVSTPLENTMFVANVSIGQIAEVLPHQPPLSTILVDSINNPKVYLFQDNKQCYPAYLISYRYRQPTQSVHQSDGSKMAYAGAHGPEPVRQLSTGHVDPYPHPSSPHSMPTYPHHDAHHSIHVPSSIPSYPGSHTQYPHSTPTPTHTAYPHSAPTYPHPQPAPPPYPPSDSAPPPYPGHGGSNTPHYPSPGGHPGVRFDQYSGSQAGQHLHQEILTQARKRNKKDKSDDQSCCVM